MALGLFYSWSLGGPGVNLEGGWIWLGVLRLIFGVGSTYFFTADFCYSFFKGTATFTGTGDFDFWAGSFFFSTGFLQIDSFAFYYTIFSWALASLFLGSSLTGDAAGAGVFLAATTLLLGTATTLAGDFFFGTSALTYLIGVFFTGDLFGVDTLAGVFTGVCFFTADFSGVFFFSGETDLLAVEERPLISTASTFLVEGFAGVLIDL